MKVKHIEISCPRCGSLLTPTSDLYAVCERCDGKLIRLDAGRMADLEAAIEERWLIMKAVKELRDEADYLEKAVRP